MQRDRDKLERLLKVKQRQKEEAMDIEDTQRLVTEIEMLKVVLYLVFARDDDILFVLEKKEKEKKEGKSLVIFSCPFLAFLN